MRTFRVGKFKVPGTGAKGLDLGICTVSLSENDKSVLIMDATGDATGGGIIDAGIKAEVKWMQSDGIMIEGFERVGATKGGFDKLEWRQWYCAYNTEDAR